MNSLCLVHDIWITFGLFGAVLLRESMQKPERWMEVESQRYWPDEQRHITPAWLLWLVGALLLHHCCWYNWLPRQYRLTPSISPLCVFQSLCSFQLPSLTRLFMERGDAHKAGRRVRKHTHTHTQTTVRSLGALICLNESPAPLYPSLHCSPVWFISGETWRHPLCPSSCPLHYEGTLASQCDPPTILYPPNMTSLHTCPTQLHKGCAAAWRSDESVCVLRGRVCQKCVDWQTIDEVMGWCHCFSRGAPGWWRLGMTVWLIFHPGWWLNRLLFLYLCGQITGVCHFDQLLFQQ